MIHFGKIVGGAGCQWVRERNQQANENADVTKDRLPQHNAFGITVREIGMFHRVSHARNGFTVKSSHGVCRKVRIVTPKNLRVAARMPVTTSVVTGN